VFLKQDVMRRVFYSLIPIFLWSIFLYGWRVVALSIVVFAAGIIAELVFEKSRNKKPSEAVLVTAMLFVLSSPPAVPLWVPLVGILFAVIMGKEVYGGFGRNIFNPAIAGRLFTYISFPLLMQTTWVLPGMFGTAGMNRQILGSTVSEALFVITIVLIAFFIISRKPEHKKTVLTTSLVATLLLVGLYIVFSYGGLRITEIDIITTATPLELMRGAQWTDVKPGFEYLKNNDMVSMFFGFRIGSIGESSIFLILAAAIYLLYTKTANWRMISMTMLSALVLTIILYSTGAMKGRLPLMDPSGKAMLMQIQDILQFVMAGSLLFVAVFMATDPISAPNKPGAQLVYGILIGGITILVRCFSGFPEGTSFAVLTANTFANLLDEYFPAPKKKSKTPPREVKA